MSRFSQSATQYFMKGFFNSVFQRRINPFSIEMMDRIRLRRNFDFQCLIIFRREINRRKQRNLRQFLNPIGPVLKIKQLMKLLVNHSRNRANIEFSVRPNEMSAFVIFQRTSDPRAARFRTDLQTSSSSIFLRTSTSASRYIPPK